ncbi:MAG TPA: PaaI family thioesterase [Capillimicrobium sp.]|nr:PaaI family thioesterase [Capillimicrobium sp.]
MNAPRTATVSWHDPADVLPHLAGLDGLGYVEAVRDGRLPGDPMMEALGIRVTEVERGRVVMTAVPEGQHMNLGGVVHGGFLSTLMDCATGFAFHSTLPPRATAPHVSASYGFLRFGRPGAELRCEARVLRAGGRVGHIRAEVHDAEGRLLATAETTHAVVSVEGVEHLRSGPSA